MRIVGFICLMLIAVPAYAAKPVTLSGCIKQAVEHSDLLKMSQTDVAAARYRVEAARSAWLPTVGFSLGQTLLDHAPELRVEGQVSSSQDSHFLTAGVSAQQVLYDFERTKHRVQAAQEGVSAAQFAVAADLQNLITEVVDSYYGAMEADKMVEITEDSIRQLSQHLNAATALFEQGAITRNDVLQTQVRLAAAEQRKAEAAGYLLKRKLQLSYLTGISVEDLALSDEAREAAEKSDKCIRAEISAASSIVRMKEAAFAEAKADYFPVVVAKAGLDFTQNSHLVRESGASLFVGLQWNLFDGFRMSSRVAEASVEAERSRYELRDLSEKLTLEQKMAQSDAKVSRSKVALAQAAVGQAEENFRINNERYVERAGTSLDVIDAQVLLDQARTNYYKAVYQEKVAKVKYQRALGCALL